jgi:hypothetical protein
MSQYFKIKLTTGFDEDLNDFAMRIERGVDRG